MIQRSRKPLFRQRRVGNSATAVLQMVTPDVRKAGAVIPKARRIVKQPIHAYRAIVERPIHRLTEPSCNGSILRLQSPGTQPLLLPSRDRPAAPAVTDSREWQCSLSLPLLRRDRSSEPAHRAPDVDSIRIGLLRNTGARDKVAAASIHLGTTLPTDRKLAVLVSFSTSQVTRNIGYRTRQDPQTQRLPGADRTVAAVSGRCPHHSGLETARLRPRRGLAKSASSAMLNIGQQ